MATLKEVNQRVESHGTQIGELQNSITKLESQLDTRLGTIESRFDHLLQLLEKVHPPVPDEETATNVLGVRRGVDPNTSTERNQLPQTLNNNSFLRHPKLDFPRFDGVNPRAWARKCLRFFTIHPIDDLQKVAVASLYLDGKADAWFLDYQTANPQVTWLIFLDDICMRFEDINHCNYVGTFNKLTQTGSVDDYFAKFEELKSFMISKNPTLSEEYFVLSFLSGLKEEIRAQVQMFQPTSLFQALYLARLQEGVSLSHHPPSTFSHKTGYNPFLSSRFSPSTAASNSFAKPNTAPAHPSPSAPAHPSPSASSSNFTQPNKTNQQLPPVRRLSPLQMKARRDQGLCYNCDEKYKPGHMCKVQQLFMLVADAEIETETTLQADDIPLVESDMEISVNALPELSMTVDHSNTTALHTAANQGHIEVVDFLLEADSSLARIARSNGKTALHSAARNGHVEVVKALLSKEPGIATRIDKKGQTALHMAAKGEKIELVEELINCDPALVNMIDNKGNTALHIATRKGRAQILRKLLTHEGTDTKAINRVGETAYDTAEKTGNSEIVAILQEHGVQSSRTIKPGGATARELKQTVSDIKHEVHYQLEHTRQTRKRVQGIAKQVNKMHAEGLNNAINSTTVVAVLIATVAFAAIFTVPGQFVDDPKNIRSGYVLGEANIAPTVSFLIFFVFDSIALFISLAVVVVQTSVVVIESKAKKQMMAVINKLMWLACVLISVAFLALAFIVVGKKERWLAIGVTIIGTTIMATTLGTMLYWVIMHRIEASNLRSIRRSSLGSRSRSWSLSASETEIDKFKKMYAI